MASATSLLAVIGSIISAIIGVIAFFSKKRAYKKEQSEKARKELDEAQKNNDASGRVSAWNRINRL